MNVSQMDIDLADLVAKHQTPILITLARDNEDWQVFSYATSDEDVAGMEVAREWLKMNILLLKDKICEAMVTKSSGPVSPSASTESVPPAPG